jgi:hypothetical protein
MDFGLGRKVGVGEGEKTLIAARDVAKAMSVKKERKKHKKGTTNERE